MSLFLLASIGHAGNIPALKQQVIQVPMNSQCWVQPFWEDINGDGLVDLMTLVRRDSKAFIYIQNASGLPSAPTQSIELPEGTAWIALYDINEHSGKEMLISTPPWRLFYGNLCTLAPSRFPSSDDNAYIGDDKQPLAPACPW